MVRLKIIPFSQLKYYCLHFTDTKPLRIRKLNNLQKIIALEPGSELTSVCFCGSNSKPLVLQATVE